MKRSFLNALAAISLAFALSGCIIAPWHHNGYNGGYGGGGYHNGGGGWQHNGY